MTWYYTVTIDENDLKAAIEDLTTRINSKFKRVKPFRIVCETEPMDEETMKGEFIRFRLVVTPDFSVKNEAQAWKFCQTMREAADEVQEMNNQNYVLAPPPPRKPGPQQH